MVDDRALNDPISHDGLETKGKEGTPYLGRLRAKFKDGLAWYVYGRPLVHHHHRRQ